MGGGEQLSDFEGTPSGLEAVQAMAGPLPRDRTAGTPHPAASSGRPGRTAAGGGKKEGVRGDRGGRFRRRESRSSSTRIGRQPPALATSRQLSARQLATRLEVDVGLGDVRADANVVDGAGEEGADGWEVELWLVKVGRGRGQSWCGDAAKKGTGAGCPAPHRPGRPQRPLGTGAGTPAGRRWAPGCSLGGKEGRERGRDWRGGLGRRGGMRKEGE